MHNVIENYRFKEGGKNNILYFETTKNVVLNKNEFKGFNVCSVQTVGNETASLMYENLITLNNNKNLNFAINIRAVDATNLNVSVKFENSSAEEICTTNKNIASLIGYNFKNIKCKFKIPAGATGAKVSINFLGETSACSFYAPQVFVK